MSNTDEATQAAATKKRWVLRGTDKAGQVVTLHVAASSRESVERLAQKQGMTSTLIEPEPLPYAAPVVFEDPQYVHIASIDAMAALKLGFCVAFGMCFAWLIVYAVIALVALVFGFSIWMSR